MRDREKLDEVAKYVVQMGYCANDTIIQTKSDTLITYDTLIEKGADIIRDIFHTDTLRFPLRKTIVKTIRIRDTINSIVVDNARIKLLEAKLAIQTEKTEEYKVKAESRLKWLILLLIAILVRILYKPLLKLIAWHS